MLRQIRSLVRRRRYGKEIIIVSGLPRSGTSMMMQMLEATHLDIVTDRVRKADEDNPGGYYEYERVKGLESQQDKSWLHEARGKVLKVISFLLKDLPSDNYYRVIFMRRDIDEIIASQNKMMKHRGAGDSTGDQQVRSLYERHLFQVKMLVHRSPNFDMLDVPYRSAISDPQSVAASVNHFLGGNLDEKAMASVVDRSLYRNREKDLLKGG